jgi:ferredoxin/flavodoxin---NADP+ reductase
MRTVFVVGAGPAGMFAAQKVALAGHQVVVFNRDIKPGGLAEYGIYPLKDKMKFGLRKQFTKVLSLPNLHYFGHVSVGNGYDLSIEDLREFNPTAMVFAVGAQGTKKLGLPGENARGVYSAKDYVYHYNLLPPFAAQDFSVGKRVAIVGMGNVMVDIARWLLVDDPQQTVEEIIVVARRGPFEAKFDDKEFEHIQEFLDRSQFQEELRRIRDPLAAVGQDASKVTSETFAVLNKHAEGAPGHKRLIFRFLCSPTEIHAGADGRIERLTVTENVLVQREFGTSAKPTGQTVDLDVDTMIFAIGDVQDANLGLPYGPEGYLTQIDPQDPRPVYEVFDPQLSGRIPGTYVVGWARRASEGLVGIARHDAEVGAGLVLDQLAQLDDSSAQVNIADIVHNLDRAGIQAVTKDDVAYLGNAEAREAQLRGMTSFKFWEDETMLRVIDEEKSRALVRAA